MRYNITFILFLTSLFNQTQVYDTNVGDISPLSSYFNPQRWTVRDLNEKFGIQTQTPEISEAASPELESEEAMSDEEQLFDEKTGQPIRYSAECSWDKRI